MVMLKKSIEFKYFGILYISWWSIGGYTNMSGERFFSFLRYAQNTLSSGIKAVVPTPSMLLHLWSHLLTNSRSWSANWVRYRPDTDQNTLQYDRPNRTTEPRAFRAFGRFVNLFPAPNKERIDAIHSYSSKGKLWPVLVYLSGILSLMSLLILAAQYFCGPITFTVLRIRAIGAFGMPALACAWSHK